MKIYDFESNLDTKTATSELDVYDTYIITQQQREFCVFLRWNTYKKKFDEWKVDFNQLYNDQIAMQTHWYVTINITLVYSPPTMTIASKSGIITCKRVFIFDTKNSTLLLEMARLQVIIFKTTKLASIDLFIRLLFITNAIKSHNNEILRLFLNWFASVRSCKNATKQVKTPQFAIIAVFGRKIGFDIVYSMICLVLFVV